MLIALCTLPGKEDEYPRLCMVPDKLAPGVTPVNLRFAVATTAAVQFLSSDEGYIVRQADSGFLEIEPLAPAILYLTPNLPSRPGFSVNKIQFKILGDNRYEVNFDRGKGWEKWEPSVKVF